MNFYTYQEALEASKKYFNGDELAASVCVGKYLLQDNEGHYLEKTPEDMHRRLAREFARIEAKKFKKPLTEQEIFELFDKFNHLVPQGGVMFGVGNDYQYVSTANCFAADSPLDQYGSIMMVDEQLVNICKRRGGVGINISNLRPAGSVTRNAAKTSTGIIPFVERYSNSVREVGQNNRRGAVIVILDVHHPEVVKFAKCKQDTSKITGANLSIMLSNEFLEAVEKNGEYEQRFPIDYKEKGSKPLISKMISAKLVWDEIVKCARDFAEPGLLMWDNVKKYTPSECYDDYKAITTNPCSELPLSSLEGCRLFLVNLFGYVKHPFTDKSKFDFELFKQHAQTAQRLTDDLVDLESEKIKQILKKIDSDPEPDYVKQREHDLWVRVQKKNNEGRRTGVGTTGVGDAFAALGIKYGSDESLKFSEKLFKIFKLSCYRSSVDMAKEIGAFKVFDAEKEKNDVFLNRIKQEDLELYNDMQKYGRRNIALNTLSPAGSVSVLTQTTSGVEPLFAMSYTRRKKISPEDKDSKVDFVDQNGDRWQEYVIYHPKLKLWMEISGEKDIKKSPWYKCCAEDLNWEDRVKLQGVIQASTDHSISSTVSLPEDVTYDTVSKIYMAAWKNGLKGITVYRKNSRTGVLIDSKQDNQKIPKTISPKRPKELKCDVFHSTFKGKRYYVVVGLLGEDPYEVFVGENDDGKGDVFIPKSIDSGILSKETRGKYVLKNEAKSWSCILTDGHTDDTVDALTRMMSTALRHGAGIEFVVHQLEKTKGDLTSFSKVLCRTIKKYIVDGTKIYGDVCPDCKNSSGLIRESGCQKCSICGWSKCG